MNSQSNNPTCGQKFGNKLVNQTPLFDGRRKHNRPVPKHSGNLKAKPKYLK